MNSTEFVLTYLAGIFSGVLIKVVGDMLNRWLGRLKMDVAPASQIFINKPTKHSEAVGFGIAITQGKGLEEAYAKFTSAVYPWWENGKPKAKTQLLVGEDPSWIFPYHISLDYIEDVTNQENIQTIIKKGDPSNHAILFSVYELDSEKNEPKNKIFERIIIMPKNAKSVTISINQLLPKIHIRLLAKGIERKMQYTGEMKIKSLSIGKLENGVPYLDTSVVNLIIYHF